MHVRLRYGTMSMSLFSNEFDVRSVLHVQVSLAAVNQICVTHEAVLIDFSLTVKTVALISISGSGSAILSSKQGISGSIYNLVKN